jgi:hypothetical protein
VPVWENISLYGTPYGDYKIILKCILSLGLLMRIELSWDGTHYNKTVLGN